MSFILLNMNLWCFQEASCPSQSQGLNKNQRKKLRTELLQKTEDEKRSEGLSSAISSSNIGFRMLQQMGYNPGKALGKHEQGTLEPLNLDVKRSRSGLGRDEIEKAKAIGKAKAREIADEAKKGISKQKRDELESGFRERRKSNWQGYKLFRDYRKAQTALQHLEGSPRQHKVPQEDDLENLEGKYLQDGGGKDAGDGPEENESDEEIELQVCFLP